MKTIYYNGTVYTGALPLAEAFIVQEGRFAFAGTSRQALEQRQAGDQLVDLQGKFVCSGFNDSHMHLLELGYTLQMPPLADHTGSLADLLDCLRDFHARHPNGISGWLMGRGWNEDLFSDLHRMPDRHDLDQVSTEVPICIIRACGHCLVVNSRALEQLLNLMLAPPAPMEYGSEKSAAFYERLFNGMGPETDCDDVKEMVEHIAVKTLEDAHDTLLFKQMTGDLLYWLSGKRGEAAKCGTDYLIHSQILPRHDIWNTSDDSLKVVQFAEVMQELLGRAQTGSPMPKIKVHATMKSSRGEKYGQYRLDRLRHDRTIFIFHTEGCNICKAELAAADSLLASGTRESRSTRVLLIDMDEIFSSWPETAEQLFNAFDLTALPYITETDRKGIIVRKYMTLSGNGKAATKSRDN